MLCGRAFNAAQKGLQRATLLRAYRWQYIVLGLREPRFVRVLVSAVTPGQLERIDAVLAPILSVGAAFTPTM